MSILSKHYQYKPQTKQVFWCHLCDYVQVDSEDESTGKFFNLFGHSYSAKTKEYDGAYTGIMFAVCNNCLTEE
jgi:hypothetical protein